MFHKIDFKHQPKPIYLTKSQSSYKKLEKEMNKIPSDYEQIKKLIEDNDSENTLKNFSNKSSINNNLRILPHKK